MPEAAAAPELKALMDLLMYSVKAAEASKIQYWALITTGPEAAAAPEDMTLISAEALED